jgi:hypothetical protein
MIRCLVNCEIGFISHTYGWSIYSRGKKVFADRNRLTAGRVCIVGFAAELMTSSFYYHLIKILYLRKLIKNVINVP